MKQPFLISCFQETNTSSELDVIWLSFPLMCIYWGPWSTSCTEFEVTLLKNVAMRAIYSR